jgi:hypothetical protein
MLNFISKLSIMIIIRSRINRLVCLYSLLHTISTISIIIIVTITRDTSNSIFGEKKLSTFYSRKIIIAVVIII